MTSMKTICAATALAGALFLNAVPNSQAGDRIWTMKPLQAVSFDIGSKRAVSYFLSEEGRCKLAFIVADQMVGDEVPDDTPVRFDIDIDAGKHANFDTAEGQALQFACGSESTAVVVTELPQVATYVAPAKP